MAIKRIGDIFSNPLDARRTLREIQVPAGRPGPPGLRSGAPLSRLQLAHPCCSRNGGQPTLAPPMLTPPPCPMQILRHVRGHSNVITLLDLFPPSAGIHDFRWARGCGVWGVMAVGYPYRAGAPRCTVLAVRRASCGASP